MPRGKPKWVPAQDLDPSFFQVPSKVNKAILIKSPNSQGSATHNINSDAEEGVPLNIEPASIISNTSTYGSVGGVSQNKQSKYAVNLNSSQYSTVAASFVKASATLPHSFSKTSSNGIKSDLHGINSTKLELSGNSSVRHSGTDTGSLNGALTPTSTETHTRRSKLDIYAPNHVPYWLKAINESYAVTDHAPQIRRIDFDAYHASFSGTDFQRQLPLVNLPPTQPTGLSATVLTEDNYRNYWHQRLQNEYTAQATQNDAFALFKIDLVLEDPKQHLYRLKVPGLRESTPRIDLGDILLIRPFMLPVSDTIHQVALQWSRERNEFAPCFLGTEHHAVVWSLIRRDEYVLVRLGKALISDVKCNVVIPLQIHKNAPAWRAVNQVAAAIETVYGRSPWLSSMLFPLDGVQQMTLPKGTFDLNWYDPTLNFEQMRAVQAVVNAKYGTVPYLISGPPGTGKTKTIVETALQLLHAECSVKPHLIVCAPSDAAADTLLVRLSAFLSPRELLRLNNWTRLASEVPGEVRPYCYLDENQLYSLPQFETIMSFKIVVTACRDANTLVTAGLTNENLISIGLRMMRAIAPAAIDATKLMHWTGLLIDEAAQATEPEVLISMSVVAPPSDAAVHSTTSILPQVIMAGDEYQLGPRLISTALSENLGPFYTAGLEVSMFQRLFERSLYADHPLSRSHGLRPLTREMLPIIRPPFTNLIRNYRSHPAILSTCSALFYNDTLIPERPDASPSILSWPYWPKKDRDVWPVMFYQNSGPDRVESILEGDGTGSGSLMNFSEAQTVLGLVSRLIDHVNQSNIGDYLRGEDIIVLSPFRAQVNYLRQLFRSQGRYDIRIGPLEAFQGLEARVVVLCTTRTRLGQHPHPLAKFVNEDKSRNLGVVDVPKQFNVAMTRAKEALIVVGHAEALTVTRDRCWVSFLRFCIRNGLCAGGMVSWFGRNAGRDSVEGAGMGKLERALRYAENLKISAERDRESYGADEYLNSRMRYASNESREPVESFKFRLRGTMINLDERMWEMQIGDEEGELIRRQEDEDDADVVDDDGEGEEEEEAVDDDQAETE